MKFAVFENVTLLPLPGKKQYMYLWRVTCVRMSFLRGLFTSRGKLHHKLWENYCLCGYWCVPLYCVGRGVSDVVILRMFQIVRKIKD